MCESSDYNRAMLMTTGLRDHFCWAQSEFLARMTPGSPSPVSLPTPQAFLQRGGGDLSASEES